MSPKNVPARRPFTRVVLPLLFWLLVWQLLAMWVDRGALLAAWRSGDSDACIRSLLFGRELLLPAPWSVARALSALVLKPLFWQSVWATLVRVFAGFLLGALLGCLLAVLCAAFSWIDALVAPAISVIRATPVASFIILLLLWMTTGLVPGVCAALMVLPVVWGSVRAAIADSTDPLLLEAARAYRFSTFKTIRLVYFPSVLPHFAAGCSTALGLSWKAGVAAEALCLPRRAIGTQLFNAKRYLETPDLFAWTAVILLLSLLLHQLLTLLLSRWKGGRPWN